MAKLKIQLHCHTGQDPIDNISHSEQKLIDEAARYGVNVLAISCHNVVIFNDDLKKYAADKRILLIPAIEKNVENKHVLILNADVSAQQIQNFEDLKKYRQKRPSCFIVAVHPYYPGFHSLGKKLDDHKELFDAIEYSWFHSKRVNKYNHKAVKMAEKFTLPVIATSDNHLLRYLNFSYSLIDAEKNTSAIFQAIRDKKIKIISHDLKIHQMIMSFLEMEIRRLVRIIMPK